MSDTSLKEKYYVRKEGADLVDVTELFDGLRILKVDGFLSQGKPVNIYNAQWINSQKEDIIIPEIDGEKKVIKENPDIEITFIVGTRYSQQEDFDAMLVHDAFIRYMTGGDLWISSEYVSGKMVHCVCLDEYKPTTVKLQRKESWVMGTLKLHTLDVVTNKEGGEWGDRVLTITENGEYYVTAYDKAIVNFPDATLGKLIRERNDYKQRYNEIVSSLNEKYPEIVGWLYTQAALYAKNHLFFTLKGADAYYIVNDGVYAYENGDATNPITYVDAEGVETVGGRDYAKTAGDMNTEYEILYGYVMNSEADGVRDYYNYIDCMYCDDAIIPVIRQDGQGHSYGFVDLNFREGYRDVSILYTGEDRIIGFSTNAETLNKLQYSNVLNANTKGLYVLQFNNLKELKYSLLIQGAHNIEKISLPALKHISAPGKTVNNNYGIVKDCRNLKELNLPNLETIEQEYSYQGTIASFCPNLERVVCPKLKTIECIIGRDKQVVLSACDKLTTISMPELTSVIMKGPYSYTFKLINLTNLDLPKLEYLDLDGNGYESLIYGSTIEELSLPSLKETTINYRCYLIQECNTLKRVYLPALEKSPQEFSWYHPNWLRYCSNVEYVYLGCRGGVGDKIGFGANNSEHLTDVEIGEGARQSIALFDINNLTRDNIVNHIFNKLADNTDGAPIRITIGATNLARLSDEDKEIALNKNYTLS